MKDWIGKSFISLILAEDLPMITEIFQKSIKGDTLKYELRLKKQDGRILTISVNTAPILKNGEVNGVVSFGRDITEQRKLETQLRQAQKMESIGTLAGGIAHDFNNILFPIIDHTEMLLEDVPEDSQSRSSLKEIYTATLRAKNLAKQILTFSRQESSELKPIVMNDFSHKIRKVLENKIEMV